MKMDMKPCLSFIHHGLHFLISFSHSFSPHPKLPLSCLLFSIPRHIICVPIILHFPTIHPSCVSPPPAPPSHLSLSLTPTYSSTTTYPLSQRILSNLHLFSLHPPPSYLLPLPTFPLHPILYSCPLLLPSSLPRSPYPHLPIPHPDTPAPALAFSPSPC